MLKNILALTLATLSSLTFAASDTSSYSKFVPQGWKILETATGDLNRDGQIDAALIIQQNNPNNIKSHEGLGSDRLNLNPRKLLVLFKTAQSYQLMTENYSLPTENDEESPCLADPLEDGGITIAKGLLKISLHYWLSCGSWYVTNNNYTFRYQNNDFNLIGFDSNDFHRASGDITEKSINFSTGKVKSTTGKNEFAETAQPVKTEWSTLKNKYQIQLQDIDFSEYAEYQ
ncbi:hypothetical protein E0H82_14810 [Acinetobacter sp. ANC 4910]|uniref:hypothetical protein n=1 Tax=Acinetobacter sp. ANC 4910 TaxID=2529850 RepID=UPI001040D76C|nr:hypothetical protein [Acinetobacter sp. ANC 4910]TCB32977.1 hypothetical protein E0H82_14810 [Acinetobacter sp. ANC 4910]